MSLTRELVDILTDGTRPDPKKEVKQFLKKCVRVQADVATIINTPIRKLNNRTPVHLAVIHGLWECLDILLKNGGDPNVQSGPADLGQTPLHHAAKKGYLQCLNILLLKHGARMDIRDSDSRRPRDVLARARINCHKVFDHTIAQNASYRQQDDQIEELHRLVESGDVERFKKIYSKLPEDYRDLALRKTDWNGNTLLYCATLNKGSEDLIQYMLSLSPYQPLHNFQTLETPLVAACRKQNHEVVRLLLKHSPSLLFPYGSHGTCLPLIIAVCKGDSVLFEMILNALLQTGEYDEDCKLNLDFYDSQGSTPLLYACTYGQVKVVKILVAFYCTNASCVTLNVNSVHKRSGCTPLHIATQLGDMAMVEILLSMENIDIDAVAKPSTDLHDHIMAVSPTPSLDTANSNSNVHSGNAGQHICQESVSEWGLSTKSESRRLVRFETDPLLREDCNTQIVSSVQFEASPPPIGVFMSSNGKLTKMSHTPGPGYQRFDELQLAPLALASAYGHHNLVILLLKHGSRDVTGLACRIAQFIEKPEFVRLILSYHCSVSKDQQNSSSDAMPASLSLNWDDKKLPRCDAANLKCDYYPNQIGDGLTIRFDSTTVSKVSLNGNHLQEVPIELFQLPNVVQINLSHNEISSLPTLQVSLESELVMLGWRCNKLKELNLSNNVLVSLPANVWCLPSLRGIDCSLNELSSFDEVKAEKLSKTLTIVKLAFNEPFLKSLPEFLFELPQLTKAILHHNHLEMLPNTVWKSKTLYELDVSHNHLTSLPVSETLRRLESSIQSLAIVSSKGIQSGSDSDKTLSSSSCEQAMTVKSLIPLQDSQPIMWNIPVRVLEGCGYSSLHTLKLSNNKLTEFPEGLPCLAPHLTELDISNNRITTVDIQFMPPSIKVFTANHCKIEQFGNILSKTAYNQVILNCHHGAPGIPCQHRCHVNLLCLKKLALARNNLKHFQLICRDHEKNEHDNIDDNIFHANTALKHLLYPVLESLDLSENCLQGRFNPNIGHQLRLRSLLLDNNRELQALPIELAYLKDNQLMRFSIRNVPNLFDPPREYHSVSLNHLLTFMKSRLKESDFYRTIKLFFVGDGMRGKTTLLNRLRNSPVERHNERTIGIDIVKWTYPDPNRLRRNDPRLPVTFLAWDFAGQESYHTSHQCFYSRRSLYLALFRLSDDMEGVNELEPWLRNIKLRAPGCPVIIICTHLDKVKKQRADELEEEVWKKYGKTVTYYPRVIDVVSVNTLQRGLIRDEFERLRMLIYDAVCHLQLEYDGISLRYNPKMDKRDPKALFQQQIPRSYIDLQTLILETAQGLMQKGRPPIMEEEEFYRNFQHNFDDVDELKEAVNFLSLQGALLHYRDRELRDVYFLDPQWLAKLMAKVIKPVENESLVKNGVANIDTLFSEYKGQKHLQDKYISLLEKFDVVQKLGDNQVIIPTLMPDSAQYPDTMDVFSDFEMSLRSFQPPLRRIWCSNFIPNGFWPRLVCRIATDEQIGKVLDTLIHGGVHNENQNYSWIRWKSGLAFVHEQTTLVVSKQEENNPNSGQSLPHRTFTLPGIHRIVIHIYLNEWIKVAEEQSQATSQELSPSYVISLATQLMVKFLVHMKELTTLWFPGMVVAPIKETVASYVPCWKCNSSVAPEHPSQLPSSNSLESNQFAKYIMYNGDHAVFCFNVDESVVPAALKHELQCPVHDAIDIKHVAPDLIFWDLINLSYGRVQVDNGSPIGIGAFGFVCKGKHFQTESERYKEIAVKIFLMGMERLNVDRKSTDELLESSRNPKNLVHAYKEIRQEVSFLSTLENPFLVAVFGVRTSPYMCFLLELAPMGSLFSVLRSYKIPLEPLTLKNTSLQIAKGLEYLHSHQIVHLDMKSQNVLVWEFPSPEGTPASRAKQAGYVWIKIADYGISQVSSRLKFKVGFPPPGTPGYMAPELYDSCGQEISADKVDVFAYGMTLYELLSFKPPFHETQIMFRNNEIRIKRRPALQSIESRSILPFQELMTKCWEHDPEDRPNMKQVIEYIDRPEFERLRIQTAVNSVRLASVFRVLPDSALPTEYGLERALDGATSPIQEYISSDSDPSSPVPRRDLPDFRSLESCDEDMYEITNLLQTEGTSSTAVTEDDEVATKMEYRVEYACTQLWMYSQNEGQGHLQILMWNDGVSGQYSCTCGSEEVTALCPVRNTVWMGVRHGILAIKAFHAPSGTLQCMFNGRLQITDQHNSVPVSILAICHVPEASSVLVSVQNQKLGLSQVWVIQDHIAFGSLTVLWKFNRAFCRKLIKANVKGSISVWGISESNGLIMFKSSQTGQWKKEGIYTDSEIYHCSLIAQTCFTGRARIEYTHIWVTDEKCPVLVALDAQTKEKYCKMNVRKDFRVDYRDFKIVSIVGAGRNLIVGTNKGIVGIIDAERKALQPKIFNWHKKEVSQLLVMPKEMKPCICAEIPHPEDDPSTKPNSTAQSSISSNRATSPSGDDTTEDTRNHSNSLPVRYNIVRRVSSSAAKYYMHNKDTDSPMVASVGVGRSYALRECMVSSVDSSKSGQQEVVLLLWRK